MEQYKSAYGIAALLVCISMLHKGIKKGTLNRNEAIEILEDSRKLIKTFKALPFDADLLDYVDESLKVAEGTLLPLGTSPGKVP